MTTRENSAAPAVTNTSDYAFRLERLGSKRWKRALDVQLPYRVFLRRLNLGLTLDVGCGIGRNLRNLGGQAVGIDHNQTAVELARQAGYRAYTPAEFRTTPYARPGHFSSILLAHVLEHMEPAAGAELLASYLPYVRPGGQAVLITPQERGFQSDSTHVRFFDFGELAKLTHEVGLDLERTVSFPFPRALGSVFPYNEFVVVARRRTHPQ